MKYFLSAVMAAGWFCLAVAAFAQATNPPPAPPAAAAPSPTTAHSGAGGKRGECLVSVQGKTGQERYDQLQLCLAQARLDCVKQAINQKVANAERKDYVRNCVREE
jgi:hypothetical protein